MTKTQSKTIFYKSLEVQLLNWEATESKSKWQNFAIQLLVLIATSQFWNLKYNNKIILVLEIITIQNKHIKIGEGRRIDWLTCKEMGFLSIDMEAPTRKVENEGWKLEYDWREKNMSCVAEEKRKLGFSISFSLYTSADVSKLRVIR